MIIDGSTLFSTAQVLTTAARSTNILDLVNPRDIGVGDKPPLKIVVKVDTTFQSTDAGTLTIQVQGSTDGSTWDVYAQSPAIAKTALVAGAQFVIDMPAVAPGKSLPRYVSLNYAKTLGDWTTGAVTAFMVLDAQQNRAYSAGVIVTN